MSNNTKKNKEVAGFIEQDGKYAVFVGNEFHFVFVPERHAKELIDKAKREEAEKNGEVEKKPQQVIFRGFPPEMTIKAENGFIRGKTYDGNTILIYTGHDIALSPIYKANTWLYIVSHGIYALDKCAAIRFRSGILRSLFVASRLQSK